MTSLSKFGIEGLKGFRPRPIKRKGKRKGKGSDKNVSAGDPILTLCFHYWSGIDYNGLTKGDCTLFYAEPSPCGGMCPNWKSCNPKLKRKYKIGITKTFMTFIDLMRKDKRYKNLIPGTKTVTVKHGKKGIKMTMDCSKDQVQSSMR